MAINHEHCSTGPYFIRGKMPSFTTIAEMCTIVVLIPPQGDDRIEYRVRRTGNLKRGD